MATASDLEITRSKPFRDGLAPFRDAFRSTCADLGIPESADAVQQIIDKDVKNLVLDLILALQSLPDARRLPSPNGCGSLFDDFSRFNSVVDSDDFEIGQENIVDSILKDDLGSDLFIGVPRFYEAFFGEIEGLETTAAAVFMMCQKGVDPLYSEELGWRDWPYSAKGKDVFRWFAELIEFFLDAAKEVASASKL